MGHWLDGLLDPDTGAGGVIIQWDGATMPARGILAFNEQFLCVDDSIGNRTMVSIRHITADGDVIGETDDLRVVQIRGDSDGEEVAMFATALEWDVSVSAGSALIGLSDANAGALRIGHQAKDVAIFAGSGAIIGNTTGLQQMLGGHRFNLRSIGSATLDTPTKDTIAWIDATGERTVILPPASVGRTLLLPFVGDNPPTLARAGAELINGVASNYTMTGDAAGGLAIAISDGANWVARTIKDGGGAVVIDGDVTGDPEANVVQSITGSGGEVLVTADNFIFTTHGSAEFKTTSEGGGALELWHDSSRVVFANSETPEFGTASGVNRLIGGLRLMLRSIAANVTLDTTTSDAIGWITGGASVGKEVTLPPASQGRTLLLPFAAGTTSHVLKPAGAETINGSEGNYTMTGDAAGGIAIAVCDGTNWIARTIAASTAVVDATTIVKGIVQLAGNLAGTAAAPFVTGARADTITVQNADGTHKGSWTTAGLRIGDNTAPTQKLDVVGSAAIGAGFAKVFLGGFPGFIDSYGAVWVGNITPSATNYAFFGDGIGNTLFNAPLSTSHISFRFAHGFVGGELTTTGLRLAADANAAVEKLEVVGRAQIGPDAAKVYIGGQVGSESTASAIWMGAGAITPSATNYVLHNDATSLRHNALTGTKHSFRINNVIVGELTSTGLRLSADGATATRRLEVDGASYLAGGVILGKNDSSGAHNLFGSMNFASVRTITADYVIDSLTAKDLTIFVDSTAGTINITLPAATTAGRYIWVKRVAGTNNINVNRTSPAIIDTATYITARLITDAGSSNIHPYVALMADGTNWRVMRHFSIILATA